MRPLYQEFGGVRQRRWGTLSNVKPAVGFTLPSAGVTPAPGEKKSQNGEDAILLSDSFPVSFSSCVIQSEAKNPGSL
jgi:hypothetical protein